MYVCMYVLRLIYGKHGIQLEKNTYLFENSFVVQRLFENDFVVQRFIYKSPAHVHVAE